MRLSLAILALALLSAQAPPAASVEDEAAHAERIRAEAEARAAHLQRATRRFVELGYDLEQGLAEVESLAMGDEYDASLALSDVMLAPNPFARWRQERRDEESKLDTVLEVVDPLFEGMGWLGQPAPHRAEIHYARGVLMMRRGKQDANGELRDRSEREYQAARALAGPGELRESAVYNMGVGLLEEAEGVRLEIPEVRQKLGLQPLPPTQPQVPPAMPGQGDDEPPDPIEVARGFYLGAREHFVERLRLDWRDEDTRANVELIQRRLKELDEIEQQREEQQQDEPQDQQSSDDSQDQDSEPSEDSDQQQDPSQEEPRENEDEGRPEEDEPSEEPEEPEEAEQPEEPQDEGERDAPKPPPEPEERLLTREEAQRLLERLEELEEEAEKIRLQLRDNRKVPVKRDW